MLLYNTWSAAQRSQWIDQVGLARITLSFYKYHDIADPKAFRDELFLAWNALDVLGRIYVALEGINAQISLPAQNMAAFHEHLESYPFLQGIRLNVAIEQDNKSFLKLKIKVREKIVADGIDDETFDATKTGAYLKAHEFNAMMDSPTTVVVDMRNHFECEIGHFEGALLPEAETFREALKEMTEALLPDKNEKEVLMYCTGGIRCEKASAYFRHLGFKNVFHLEGGIIEYARQIKAEGLENKFLGKNFVFDQRLSERISDHVVSTCHQCGAACDTHVNCGNKACNLLFLQCPNCREQWRGCCSERCKEIAGLPFVQQKGIRRGYSSHAKYFKKQRPA